MRSLTLLVLVMVSLLFIVGVMWPILHKDAASPDRALNKQLSSLLALVYAVRCYIQLHFNKSKGGSCSFRFACFVVLFLLIPGFYAYSDAKADAANEVHGKSTCPVSCILDRIVAYKYDPNKMCSEHSGVSCLGSYEQSAMGILKDGYGYKKGEVVCFTEDTNLKAEEKPVHLSDLLSGGYLSMGVTKPLWDCGSLSWLERSMYLSKSNRTKDKVTLGAYNAVYIDVPDFISGSVSFIESLLGSLFSSFYNTPYGVSDALNRINRRRATSTLSSNLEGLANYMTNAAILFSLAFAGYKFIRYVFDKFYCCKSKNYLREKDEICLSNKNVVDERGGLNNQPPSKCSVESETDAGEVILSSTLGKPLTLVAGSPEMTKTDGGQITMRSASEKAEDTQTDGYEATLSQPSEVTLTLSPVPLTVISEETDALAPKAQLGTTSKEAESLVSEVRMKLSSSEASSLAPKVPLGMNSEAPLTLVPESPEMTKTDGDEVTMELAQKETSTIGVGDYEVTVPPIHGDEAEIQTDEYATSSISSPGTALHVFSEDVYQVVNRMEVACDSGDVVSLLATAIEWILSLNSPGARPVLEEDFAAMDLDNEDVYQVMNRMEVACDRGDIASLLAAAIEWLLSLNSLGARPVLEEEFPAMDLDGISNEMDQEKRIAKIREYLKARLDIGVSNEPLEELADVIISLRKNNLFKGVLYRMLGIKTAADIFTAADNTPDGAKSVVMSVLKSTMERTHLIAKWIHNGLCCKYEPVRQIYARILRNLLGVSKTIEISEKGDNYEDILSALSEPISRPVSEFLTMYLLKRPEESALIFNKMMPNSSNLSKECNEILNELRKNDPDLDKRLSVGTKDEADTGTENEEILETLLKTPGVSEKISKICNLINTAQIGESSCYNEWLAEKMVEIWKEKSFSNEFCDQFLDVFPNRVYEKITMQDARESLKECLDNFPVLWLADWIATYAEVYIDDGETNIGEEMLYCAFPLQRPSVYNIFNDIKSLNKSIGAGNYWRKQRYNLAHRWILDALYFSLECCAELHNHL